MPAPLELRLDCAGKEPGNPLVLLAARLNNGVYQTPGLRIYPGLLVAFPTGGG